MLTERLTKTRVCVPLRTQQSHSCGTYSWSTFSSVREKKLTDAEVHPTINKSLENKHHFMKKHYIPVTEEHSFSYPKYTVFIIWASLLVMGEFIVMVQVKRKS